SPAIASIGSGLLTTVSISSGLGNIAGFQILVGVGLGCVTQLPVVVAQAEFVAEEDLVPQATSIVTFLQLLGSSIGLAAAGAVFSGELHRNLRSFPPQLVQALLSSVKVIATLPNEDQILAKGAYLNTIDKVFILAVTTAGLASTMGLIIPLKRIKETPTS
ncbi:MAG: hypothetical protein NXY57DRAFT_356642, partial [Lentinula lateritia]